MFGTNEMDFPHKLSLTDRQVANLPMAFTNSSYTDIIHYKHMF